MGYSVALDAAGDVYVAGNAKGIYSNTDLIVLKYDAAGNLLWEYRSPPLNPDTIYTKQHITPHQLNISDSGDIHVFIDTNRSSYGSIILNTQGIVLREFVLPGLLDTELQRFLAKIDNTGNIVAFNQLQKSDIRSPYADSLIGQKIKKFDSFGMLLWEIDNLNVHHIETLLLDQANDILAVTITYEAGKFVKKLAKINSVDGTTQWSIDFPGTLYWGPTTLAIDEQNNIYIDDVNFYSTTVVAKVSPSGELLWKSTPVFTNPANQEVKLNTDSTGRVLLTRLTSNNGLMDRTYKGLMVRTYVFNAQGHFITTIDALDTDIAWTGVDVQDHVYHLTVPVIANNHTLTLTQYLVPN